MMHRKGGKLLGEGTYGCVFYPPIKCDGETRRKSGVGKIVKNLHNANDEIKIAKQLLKMDPTGKYTNPIVSECMIKKKNITKKDEENIICGVTNTLNDMKTYKQIIYKYKGKDLLVSTEEKDIKKFMHLISGLTVLQKHNICHRDIKEQNILAIKNRYVYIDFGLSLKLNSVYSEAQYGILMYDYMYYPPEFKIYGIMSDLLHAKEYDNPITLVDDIYYKMDYMKFTHAYKNIKAELKTLGVYKHIRTNVYSAVYRIVHDTFHLTPLKRDTYFSKLAKYVDVFSLGVVMLNESAKEDELFDNLSVAQSTLLNTIIKNALAFDVFDRYTVDELLDNFKAFLGHKKRSTNCVDHFTLDTLKSMAKKNSLQVSGNKQELYDRLHGHLKI